MKINVFELDKMTSDQEEKILRRSEIDIEQFQEAIRPVIEDVAATGDAALVKYCKKFDRVDLSESDLKVTEAEFAEAEKNLEPEIKEVIRISYENIRKFHEAQMPEAG